MKTLLIFFSLLIATPLGGATKTWDGGASNTNWTDANNWTGFLSPPVAGDSLVFSAGVAAVDTASDNNLVSGTAFVSLIFQDYGYSVSGNSSDLAIGGMAAGYVSVTGAKPACSLESNSPCVPLRMPYPAHSPIRSTV